MDENSKDNLNDFFRSKLSDHSQSENQWNVPPDSVFEEAMKVVRTEKKKKRRGFIIVFMLVGLVIALGWIGIRTGNYIHEVNKKVENLEQSIKKIEQEEKNDLIALSDDLDEGSYVHKSDSTSDAYHSHIIPGTIQTSGGNELLENSEKKDLAIDQEMVDQSRLSDKNNLSISNASKTIAVIDGNENISGLSNSNKNTSDPDIYQSFLVNNEKQQTESDHKRNEFQLLTESRKRSGLKSINSLELQSRLLDIPYPRNLFSHVRPFNPDDFVTKSRAIVMGLFVNSNFSSFSMQNVHDDPNMRLLEYDKPYQGYGLEINLEYPFSKKWSLKFAASYNKIKNESLLENQLYYDKNNETTNPLGESRYFTNVVVENPMGVYRSSVDFKVESDDIADMDKIDQVSRIDQKLSVIGASLGARYYPVRLDKFSLLSGIGFGINHVTQLKSAFNTELFMDNKMMVEHEANPADFEKTKSNFLSVYGEIGGEYIINKNWSLYILTQYNRSLSSLRYHATPNDPKTFLNQINVGLGTKINF